MGQRYKGDRANDRQAPTASVQPPRETGPLLVENVMSADVATVTPDTSAREAARIMRDRDIGFLPVCDVEGGVLGVLTDRDLVLGVLAADRGGDLPVEEVMTPDPITCRGQDDLRTCERLMSEHQVHRMVVIGEDGHLEGVVSLADLAAVETEQALGDVVADVRLGNDELDPHH